MGRAFCEALGTTWSLAGLAGLWVPALVGKCGTDGVLWAGAAGEHRAVVLLLPACFAHLMLLGAAWSLASCAGLWAMTVAGKCGADEVLWAGAAGECGAAVLFLPALPASRFCHEDPAGRAIGTAGTAGAVQGHGDRGIGAGAGCACRSCVRWWRGTGMHGARVVGSQAPEDRAAEAEG